MGTNSDFYTFISKWSGYNLLNKQKQKIYKQRNKKNQNKKLYTKKIIKQKNINLKKKNEQISK